MPEQEVTTNEIMEFLKDNMVMRSEFTEFRSEVIELRNEFTDFKHEFTDLKQRTTNIEATMVTKSYLDDKLGDLGSEIGKRINEHTAREQKFKHEVIAFLRRHVVGAEQELQKLEELV